MRCPVVAEQGHHEATEHDHPSLGKLITLPKLAVGSGPFRCAWCQPRLHMSELQWLAFSRS